jgi:hypothetical protein
MDTANDSPPWWQVLPEATASDVTDVCGTCGISRDRPKPVGCEDHGNWRTLAYIGQYDRVPDGQWNVALGDGPAEDWRDPNGRAVWWITRCVNGHALSPENYMDGLCGTCGSGPDGDDA